MELGWRVALCNLLAPVVSRLTTEEVRVKIGDSESSAGNTRDDIGHIKARRGEAIGLSRLLWICECLDADPHGAIAMAAPRRLAA